MKAESGAYAGGQAQRPTPRPSVQAPSASWLSLPTPTPTLQQVLSSIVHADPLPTPIMLRDQSHHEYINRQRQVLAVERFGTDALYYCVLVIAAIAFIVIIRILFVMVRGKPAVT